MAQNSRDSRRAISLAELATFNTELAALARAGVPLEPALARLALELPGRAGRFVEQVAQRTAAGMSLADAVAGGDEGMGPVYRAVVEAGVRSGRLSIALDTMGNTFRQLSEMHRVVLVGLLYPLAVALLTLPAGLYLGLVVLPKIKIFHAVVAAPTSQRTAEVAHAYTLSWGPATSSLFALIAVAWWLWSRRAFRPGASAAPAVDATNTEAAIHSPAASPRRAWLLSERLLNLWPPYVAREMRREGNLAALAEILAELVAASEPLHRSLLIAGEATGDARIGAATRRFALLLEQGAKPSVHDPSLAALPRLFIWLLVADQARLDLERVLRRLAESYRAGASVRAEGLRDWLPTVFTLSVGGTALFSYALWLFVPWTRTLVDVARSIQ